MAKGKVMVLVLLSFATGYLLRAVNDAVFPVFPDLSLARSNSWNSGRSNPPFLNDFPAGNADIYLNGTVWGQWLDINSNGELVIEERENNGVLDFSDSPSLFLPPEVLNSKPLDVTQPQPYEQNLRYRNLGLF